MCSIDPRPVVFRALESRLIVLHAPYKGTHEQYLCELSAGVEAVGAEIGVDFINGGESRGGEGARWRSEDCRTRREWGLDWRFGRRVRVRSI